MYSQAVWTRSIQTGLNDTSNTKLTSTHNKKMIIHLLISFYYVCLFSFSLLHSNHQLCEDLFTKINDNNTDNNMSYSVEVRFSQKKACH